MGQQQWSESLNFRLLAFSYSGILGDGDKASLEMHLC